MSFPILRLSWPPKEANITKTNGGQKVEWAKIDLEWAWEGREYGEIATALRRAPGSRGSTCIQFGLAEHIQSTIYSREYSVISDFNLIIKKHLDCANEFVVLQFYMYMFCW